MQSNQKSDWILWRAGLDQSGYHGQRVSPVFRCRCFKTQKDCGFAWIGFFSVGYPYCLRRKRAYRQSMMFSTKKNLKLLTCKQSKRWSSSLRTAAIGIISEHRWTHFKKSNPYWPVSLTSFPAAMGNSYAYTLLRFWERWSQRRNSRTHLKQSSVS